MGTHRNSARPCCPQVINHSLFGSYVTRIDSRYRYRHDATQQRYEGIKVEMTVKCTAFLLLEYAKYSDTGCQTETPKGARPVQIDYFVIPQAKVSFAQLT